MTGEKRRGERLGRGDWPFLDCVGGFCKTTFCCYCHGNYLANNQREKISCVNIFSLATPVILVLIGLYTNLQTKVFSIFIYFSL